MLVIYVGTVLTREVWATHPGLRVEGGGLPGREPRARPSSTLFYGAPFHFYPQNISQLPQEAERFIAVK